MPLTEAEFAAMYESSSQALWCIAAAVLGDRTHADDALQEAALIGLQKLGDFEPGTSFRAWMGQIVRNVARNHGRRRHRHAALDIESVEPARGEHISGSSPVTGDGRLRDDQESFDDQVLHALNSLGETARACVLLRTVMDTPYDEIAAILDIPEGTAMSHVHRARHEMRRRLSGDVPAKQAVSETRDDS
jgi:RNA polymerase sigma-70 factor (ECF subfamily)